MSIAIVTDSITPYMNRLYDAFAGQHAADLHVFQCAAIEPIRTWKIPPPCHYRLTTLGGLRLHHGETRTTYFNPQIVAALARIAPDILIVSGFTPTMAIAALYAHARGLRWGIAFDGSRQTDLGERSRVHGLLRHTLIPRATFGICASEANRDLLAFWGMDKRRTALCPFVSGWDAPAALRSFEDRPFDLLFSGRLDPGKNPLFFADVVELLIERGMRPRVRVLGDGTLRGPLEARLNAFGIDAHFDGTLQQHELAAVYGSARLVLFPTRSDAWGLVANEAAMCGTPIIASPFAVSSRELVERFQLGHVRPLDVEAWSAAALDILSSQARWQSFMAHREEAMDSFSLDRAVAGMAEGIALGRTLPPPSRAHRPGEAALNA